MAIETMNISKKNPVFAYETIGGFETENGTIADDKSEVILHTELILKDEFPSEERTIKSYVDSVIEKSKTRPVSSSESYFSGHNNASPLLTFKTSVKEEYGETSPELEACHHIDSGFEAPQTLQNVKRESSANQHQDDEDCVCSDNEDPLACWDDTAASNWTSAESVAKFPTESKIHWDSRHIKLVDVEDILPRKIRRLEETHTNLQTNTTDACAINGSCLRMSVQSYSKRSQNSDSDLLLSKCDTEAMSSAFNSHSVVHSGSENSFGHQGYFPKIDEMLAVKNHLKVDSTEISPKSEQRSAEFTKKLSLRTDLILRDEKSFDCQNCSTKFTTSGQFNTHLRGHIDEKPFGCKQCPAQFKTNNYLKAHLQVHSDVKPFNCEQCSAKFKRKTGLKQHLKVHSDLKPFNCEQCSAKFRHTWVLKDHLKVHSGLKLFECEQCSAKFRRKQGLEQHLMTHSDLKPFECKLCSVEFKSNKDIKAHLLVHSNEKPFNCEQCPAKFRYELGLKEHLTEHSDLKPFECKQCSAKFKTNNYLKSHLRVHSDVKPFHCEQCSAKFKRKAGLKEHLKVHSDLKPFNCEQCSAKFRHEWVLKDHVKVHSDLHPFECEQCSAKFKRKRGLKQHLWTHSDLKPFECKLCSKICSSKRHLLVHLLVHSDEKPFNCEQ